MSELLLTLAALSGFWCDGGHCENMVREGSINLTNNGGMIERADGVKCPFPAPSGAQYRCAGDGTWVRSGNE